MDAAAATAAGSRAKTFNVLVSSSTGRMANHTNLIQPVFSSSRKEMRPLYTCSKPFPSRFHSLKGFYPCSGSKTGPVHPVSCSMKPRIDKNNATNKNPTTELDQKSTAPNLDTPPPNPPVTSTSSQGLVFNLGPSNSWDCLEVGSPVVKRYIGDNEERWYIWYHGRRGGSEGSESIGLAVSSNGIHWARGGDRVRSCADAGMVMNCRNSWWAFDTESIRPSEMVIMSSPMYSAVYWLYYTGYSSDEIDLSEVPTISLGNPERFSCDQEDNKKSAANKIRRSLPGLACSQDGRHWARIEGDHHSGALLDVGSEKEWDSLFIAAPHVIVHESDDLRMYYYSFDKDKCQFAIGLARSRDGIRWVKYGKILEGGSSSSFDECGVKNACVVKNRKAGNYLMAYEGVAADGKRSIGVAVSEDGLKNWKRLQEGPVLQPSEDEGWDNKGVGSPCLVQMENSINEWRLYYGGFGIGGRTGIGMAVSGGSDIRTFRRWSGFGL
ncbi:uncharacterized protein J3R85_008598 [Psidium guajava]|nr:uncharacterized protein J3R85_008598 [Psidium guajava]